MKAFLFAPVFTLLAASALAAQSVEWCQGVAAQQSALEMELAQPGLILPQQNLEKLKAYIASRAALSDPAKVAAHEAAVAEAERNIQVLAPVAEKSEKEVGPARDTLTDLQIDYEKAHQAVEELKQALAQYTTVGSADPATAEQLKTKVAQAEKDLAAREKVVKAHQEHVAQLNASVLPLTDARTKLQVLRDFWAQRHSQLQASGQALKSAVPTFDPEKPELSLNDVQATANAAVQAQAVLKTKLEALKAQFAQGGCQG